jgi:4-amino-4-deoxy-L-arabinose transferase-like glycosyltransferase
VVEARETVWQKACPYLPWVALAAYALCCVVFWVDPQWRPEWDGATYLLTGQALAAGEGYTYQGQPFFLRPPGLAWMLSLLVRDGAYDFHTVNFWLMVWSAATVMAAYLAIRPLHGTPMALAVALLSGTSPLFVANFNFVLSEFPFAAMLFASVALLHRAAERGPRWWLWAVGGGLVLGTATYLRTIGVLMLPGLLLLGATRDRGWHRWRAVLPFALVVLLILPWLKHSQDAAAIAPKPSEQLRLHSYSTAMWHRDTGDPDSPLLSPGDWMRRVQRNGRGAASDVSRGILHLDNVVARSGLLVLLLTGWGLALRRKPTLLEWYAAASAVLLLTYFNYDQRFLLPLTPLLYLYALIPLDRATRWLGGRFGKRALAGGGLVVAGLLLANLVWLPRALAPQRSPLDPTTTLGDYWEFLHSTAAWLRDNTPPDAVILCNQAPQIALLSGRGAYTYRYLREPAPLTRYGVDYVVFDSPVPKAFDQYVSQHVEEQWLIPTGVPGFVVRVCRIRK